MSDRNRIDIIELEKESRRRLSLIRKDSIKVQNGKLTFHYMYLSHLPNPYNSYFDESRKDFHIIIQRDAFAMGSAILEQSFVLPEEARKIRIDYQGNNLDNLSDEERIEHFFPKLKSAEGERHKDGIDISGYDGWLSPEED